MVKQIIMLDDEALKKVIKAYKEVDAVTDLLVTKNGDNWGELSSLGDVWSELHDIIDAHVETTVEEAVELYDLTGEVKSVNPQNRCKNNKQNTRLTSQEVSLFYLYDYIQNSNKKRAK